MARRYTSRKFIQYKFYNDQEWLERGIVALYKRQTNDEKSSEATRHDNNQGFNVADAKYLSKCARWILAGQHLDGAHVAKARNRMFKYATQLSKIANGRTA